MLHAKSYNFTHSFCLRKRSLRETGPKSRAAQTRPTLRRRTVLPKTPRRPSQGVEPVRYASTHPDVVVSGRQLRRSTSSRVVNRTTEGRSAVLRPPRRSAEERSM